MEPNYVFVSDEKGLLEAVAQLNKAKEIAFDTEGVKLSRRGPLTVASFLALGTTDPVYLIDVQALGARAFCKNEPSLRTMLQDPNITKITFDCRTDSDALYHQFGVSLTGVLDLQVFDQAIRIQSGAAPPMKTSRFVVTSLLHAMGDVITQYGLPQCKAEGPHKSDPGVWGKRPLKPTALAYAANDVVLIKELLQAMRDKEVSELLMRGVHTHSARYACCFRDSDVELTDKWDRLVEHPIVEEELLPKGHPRAIPSLAQLKWDLVVSMLEDGLPDHRVFNHALFVLQHNDWYTPAARSHLRELLEGFPHLTEKQRDQLGSPKRLQKGQGRRRYF